MKKFLLSCVVLFTIAASAQTDYYVPVSGLSNSANGRAPQGARPCTRSIWIITAAEMAASGLVSGDVINSLGFNYMTAQPTATTGTIAIYLQNTADATNLKSTTWSTAITGMTTVSNSSVTIPAITGNFDIPFVGGTTFTYTGGALYVAFDYQNFTNPLAAINNVAYCNSQTTASILTVMAATTGTTAPTALTASNFRPETRLGKPVACAKPTNLNYTNQTLNSVDLTFDVTGGGTVDLEYGYENFVQGSGIATITNAVSPVHITGLTPSTVYQFSVRKNCGSGVYSAWRSSLPFNTIYEPTVPTYNTSFEEPKVPLLGWITGVVPPTANDWLIGIFNPSAPQLVQDGNNVVYSVTPTASAADAWLLSRGVNLVAGTVTTITYYVANYVGGNPVSTNTTSYQLTVGTSQTSAAQTTVLATETGISSTTYALKTYTFMPAATGTYYFGFHNNSPANPTGTHAILVDNFTVSSQLAVPTFETATFDVYPNPVINSISISNPNNETITGVAIFDINGRMIKQERFNSKTDLKINVSEMASGIYTMKIDSEKGQVVKKMIKN
jgi:hypothetical protein